MESHYYCAFNVLLRKSAPARRDFRKCLLKQIRSEMKAYGSAPRKTSQVVNLTSISDFSWETVMKEVVQNMPTLHACVASACARNRADAEKLLRYIFS